LIVAIRILSTSLRLIHILPLVSCNMIGLVLDALVLMGLVMALQGGTESPSFFKAILIGLGISIVSFASLYALVPLLGIVALILIFPLLAAIAAGALWLGFDVEPLKAALGGVIFLVYKIGLSLVFYFAFGT